MWGSSARRAEWPEVRISGHASELCYLFHAWDRGSRGGGRSRRASGRVPLRATQAQSPVTPEPSAASGPGARKLCPETAQVRLGSDRGLPSVAPVPCAGPSYSRPQFPHTNFSRVIRSFRSPAFVARLAPGVWRANTRDPRKCPTTLSRTGPEVWDSIIRGGAHIQSRH